MPATAADAHRYLVNKGHVEPVVALSEPDGPDVAGDPLLPAEIGSITKVFTGLLLAVMAEAGAVRLQDRVADVLPAGTSLSPKLDMVTLEHLACHRSGLPRLPPGLVTGSMFRKASMLDPYAHIDGNMLIASLARTKVHGTPGTAPVRYSNYGAGLLGYLLGLVSGMGYESTLAELVLQPLGLARTSFADAPLRQGHRRGKPVPPWHLGALAGAGGLRSSAQDLLRFAACVRDQTGPLAGPIAETLRPRVDRGRVKVGLGWFMLDGGALLMHDGGTNGARSEIRVEPHSGRCVVVFGDARRGTPKAAGMLLDPQRSRSASDR